MNLRLEARNTRLEGSKARGSRARRLETLYDHKIDFSFSRSYDHKIDL